MKFFKVLSKTAVQPSVRKRNAHIKRTVFALIIAALFAGCAGCSQCKSCKSGQEDTKVIRTPADVTDFSVVFINGEATLYWTDSKDTFLDYIEVTWEPGGSQPIKVAKGVEKLVIPGLEWDKMYYFTVRAVDQWGNKSNGTTGGTGKAYKQRRPTNASPTVISGIKGTPVAGQVVLSWTNLSESEYEYIEIYYDPDHEKLFRIPKGVESRMLTDLTNGIEHTFYVAAVDAQGNRKPVKELGLFITDKATSPESVYGRPSNGQITLVWNDPKNPELDHLEVMYSPNGEVPVTVGKGVQTKTFTNLFDTIEYEFTVYAADIAGHRRPLTGVNLLTQATPGFTGEDAESLVVRGKPVAGQIRLDWDDPEMAGLDHVEIIYNPGGGDVPVSVGKGVQNKTFNGLSDDQEYSFLVYGVDSRGNKRGIRGVRLSTPKLPVLKAKPVSKQVTVVWKDPDDPYLDHMEISYSPGGEKPVSVPKGVEKYTFTNLLDNQEYEFFVKAITSGGNKYALASAGLIVPEFPVLRGKPVDGRLSIMWDDLKDIKMDHVEIIYSPGGEKARSIAKGMENQTFTGLTDGREYAFTVYALDNAGNKFPIRSARFYQPEVAVLPPPPPPVKEGLTSLIWKPTNNTTFGDSTVLALSYGNIAGGTARWIAGGTDGKIAYSIDNGINWVSVTDTTFGSFSVNAIGYNNGRWIAVGNSGKIAWSTNAATWTAVKETYFSMENSINAIAYGNGRWIAGGTNGLSIWSQDNGVTWNPVPVTGFANNTINTVAFHDARWIIGGAQGKIAYSDDNGLSWTSVTSAAFSDSDVNVVIYDKGRWMAGGYGSRIAWSADGITWRNLTRPFYILGMGYNGMRWIAGGQEGRLAWSGDSGDNWVQDQQGRDLFGESWVRTVVFGRISGNSGRWLSGGQNGKILYADEL